MGDDVFVDVKRRTVAYLEEYVEGVERPQRRVALAIDRLASGAGAATLFDRGWPSGRATIPWRMGAADYLAAVASDRERVALAGRLPPAPWDPELVEVMAAHGVAVYEEELRAGLLSAMSSW